MTADEIHALPVHPIADRLPMLGKDALEQLAANIKTNGQLHPLVLKKGVLIDGRNRRAACKLAGVKPRTIEMPGDDPVAFIVAMTMRRNQSKGQQAMFLALAYPEPGAARAAVIITGPSGGYLSHARTVLRETPALVDVVLAGSMALDEAYKAAQLAQARIEGKTREPAPQKQKASEPAPKRAEPMPTLAPSPAETLSATRTSSVSERPAAAAPVSQPAPARVPLHELSGAMRVLRWLDDAAAMPRATSTMARQSAEGLSNTVRALQGYVATLRAEGKRASGDVKPEAMAKVANGVRHALGIAP